MKTPAVVSIALLIMATLWGCTTPNMTIASTTNSNYKFSKREKIIVALPKRPTETETLFVPTLKESLLKAGFTLVEDLTQASRILTFHIQENTTLTNSLTPGPSWLETLKKGETSVRKDDGQIISTDTAQIMIEISLLDIARVKTDKNATIWRAVIYTEMNLFEAYPEEVVKKLLKTYGKNEVKKDRFKKPKE